MEVGRNDLCPCGSGKKYKKCCLQKDMAAAPRKGVDFGYESDLAVRGKTVDKLDRLLKESVPESDLRDFIEEFWKSVFVPDAEIQALRADAKASYSLRRQIPMAIRNAFLLGGGYPAEHFLTAMPDRFTSAERAFLTRCIAAPITFIQLREFFPEAGYTLVEDIFDGRAYKVFDKAFSQSGSPHAIVSARLVPMPDGRGHVLEQVGLGVFFPEDKPVLVEALQHEARRFSELEDGETIRGKVPPKAVLDMLSREPLTAYWIEILMANRERTALPPRLANTDGEPLVQIEARYPDFLPDPDSESILPQIKAQLAERWLTDRIPALGGKTPLQAAKTAPGRKELQALFAYMESMEARRPAGKFHAGWDVDEMKKRLGLPAD